MSGCLLATSALAEPPPASPAAPVALPGAAPGGGASASVDVPVIGKIGIKVDGFVEVGAILDSSQSFNDFAGNTVLQRPGTYRGDHPRFTFSARDSRVGLRLTSEARPDLTVTGAVEVDFLGAQAGDATEAAVFSAPLLRLRQAYLKIATPYVDVLVGQSWQLFGWQPAFFPNSVQIQGLPGQAFSRAPQLRVSHRFRTEPVDVEVAVAAARAPGRDSAAPDGQAGVRVVVNRWRGLRTVAAAGTAIEGLSIGVSGAVRRIAVPELAAAPLESREVAGYGLSVDALIPVVPASEERRGNSLTLQGSFVAGRAVSDLVSNLTGGVTFPALPPNADGTAAPAFAPGIDNGLVTYDSAGRLRAVAWTAVLGGLQYYLPPGGRAWVSANYGHLASGNMAELAPKGLERADFVDVNVFWDALPHVRIGAEYAFYLQRSVDAVETTHHRGELAAFYLF